MSDSIDLIFMKVFAVNLILVGTFAVVVSLIAIYRKKYDEQQIVRLYLYLVGGALLMIIGAFLYE